MNSSHRQYFFLVKKKPLNVLRTSCFLLAYFLTFWFNSLLAQRHRTDILLNDNWKTIANDSNQRAYDGFEQASFKTANWQTINIPHNWDAYDGYRRMLHGNKHGYAWYTKTFKAVRSKANNYRSFLFFEGIGSYATVYLNGKQVGYHAGGRTSFTIDVSDNLSDDGINYLAIRADHPANIKDLPWVCGGCSDERGFSEGSQPMGIFRPVHLITTDVVRIEPFGVHIWNDATASEKSTTLHIETTIKNYASNTIGVSIYNDLYDANGKLIRSEISGDTIPANSTVTVKQLMQDLSNINLWNLSKPYLYKVVTHLSIGRHGVDRVATPYGIRSIKWDRGNSNRFFLNGKPIFINGIAEYEHLLGNSHAFTNEQIASRAKMVKQLGFNAFRDAHQPHNLLYQHYWDSLGILSWTQHSAHVWYDTKEFRENFKTLLKEWVIERRNSPSIILWGLQNESKLPKDFAEECTALIRSLDPTASSQRLVTTCNGGEGTDWDVPQNWTGTYGGNPNNYNEDVKRQVLVGEYGAWRTLDLHTEGNFKQNGALSEDRFTQLMETKIRLAEQVKDSSAGQFHWLLTSHDNPGRVQGGEGLRELDRIGPVNYKGLLTPWEEPTDAYYMYRGNYAPKVTEPMVYIVSHTWPSRWTGTGKKDSVIVYSNCDEVELFNDVNQLSLGKRKKGAIGTHFQWDGVNINYNVLYAIGYVNGKAVVKDYIVLNHLPNSPNFSAFNRDAKNITSPQPNYNYIYRLNCGGGNYRDENGNTWSADRAVGNKQANPSRNEIRNQKPETGNSLFGSSSWTDDFPGMPSFFASQRRANAPIAGTKDWTLFQDFRYGRDKLKFEFPLPDGEYLVELYFVEPWLGIGSKSDCKDMRLFDVAINDKTVLHNVDIWKEAGTNTALKKTIKAKIVGGKLVVSFPNAAAGQALISAIAIASLNKSIAAAKPVASIIEQVQTVKKFQLLTWCDNGMKQFVNDNARFVSLPSNLYGADYLLLEKNNNKLVELTVRQDADLFVAVSSQARPSWLKGFEDTKMVIENDAPINNKFPVYRKRYQKGNAISLNAGNEPISMSVFVLPVTNMQPAYDLKPTASYKPLQAKISLGAERTTVNTKDAITFKSNMASLEWHIVTGVADIYSITIRYANETGKYLNAVLQLLQADGTLMKEESLSFTQSKTGKWNYAVTNSGSMINAGNYIIKVKATDAMGLSISALDIQ